MLVAGAPRAVNCDGGQDEDRAARYAARWRSATKLLLAFGCLLAPLPTAGAAEGPALIYPGGDDTALLDEACPTFIWSQVAEADHYELVVYRLDEADEPSLQIAVQLPEGTGSWKPLANACLSGGARYGWSVRAVAADGPGDWTPASRFEIVLPTYSEVRQALRSLRRYLEAADVAAAGDVSAQVGADLPQSDSGQPEDTAPTDTTGPGAPEDARAGRAAGRRKHRPFTLISDALSRALPAPAAPGPPAPPDPASTLLPVDARRQAGQRLAAGIAPGPPVAGIRAIQAATSGKTVGVWGESASSDGVGVYGSAPSTNGFTSGVFGSSAATGGSGVYGWATSANGYTSGLYGLAESTQGQGVYGLGNATSGINYGVFGRANSTQGSGVHGEALTMAGTVSGVEGVTFSSQGRGVYGIANSTLGTNFGVYGIATSTSGRGVYGEAAATVGNNYGVYGLTDSVQGIGVFGWANATTGTSYGVYGRADSASGYAGYFAGRVHVNGTLSKSAGSFLIDHPLDPANRYLAHSFVESPEMTNLYSGTVVLDDGGAAWVELPDWFDALNRDVRYQLTPLRAPAPGLYVASTVERNRFRIAGGAPGLEVSWQITGVRDDAYARAHPIVVDQDKEALRGRYLNPEEHGVSAELGIYRTPAVSARPPTP